MRQREEIWAIPQNQRDSIFESFTQEEIKQLAKGYANTAEAVADYLGLRVIYEPAPSHLGCKGFDNREPDEVEFALDKMFKDIEENGF